MNFYLPNDKYTFTSKICFLIVNSKPIQNTFFIIISPNYEMDIINDDNNFESSSLY